jgi:hypothetical protein
MSLISVVQDVCAVVGVSRPSSIFSGLNSSRTQQELLALANEMAQRIAYDTREWGAMKNTYVFTPPGTPPDPSFNLGPTESYPLPANFKRLLLTSEVWRSSNKLTPLTFVPDTQQWISRRYQRWSTAPGDWTLTTPHNIWIAPPLTPAVPAGPGGVPPAVAAETGYFIYLMKDCVNLSAGGSGDVFMSDTDTFKLDERLLKLGMVFQWKANKGSPYAEDMGTYSDALAVASGADTPAPIIIGRLPISATANVAFPWPPTWGPR